MARILVGFDGSEPSRRALAWALSHAKATGQELVLLTVIPASVAKSSLSHMMPAGVALPASMAKTFHQNARERLDEVVAQHRNAGVAIQAAVREGEPGKAFLDAVAEFDAREIVIGHKSFETDDLKLGPVAERLVKHMPATVTVVR